MTSNPFTRLTPAPIEGRELNPVLQDIGLAIHPPLLYLGYVGFSVSFSFAVAALMDGRINGPGRAGCGRGRLPLGSPAASPWGPTGPITELRLGSIMVLGPNGERVIHAVACRNSTSALRHRHGKAVGPEDLDAASGDPDILALASRYVSGAVRECLLPSMPSPPIRPAACSSSPS